MRHHKKFSVHKHLCGLYVHIKITVPESNDFALLGKRGFSCVPVFLQTRSQIPRLEMCT